ncbi:MAG: DNA recombination protein RmuC [Hyphococcus sp.]
MRRSVVYRVGWTMDFLPPSVQDGPDSASPGEQSLALQEPLIEAPTPVLWLGFGVFAVFFLLFLVFAIRARVIAPARRRQAAQEAIFEPAGADAEITFDELEAEPARSRHEREDHARLHEDAAPLETRDKDHPQPADHSEKSDGGRKKSRSPFAGIFSKKKKQDRSGEQAFLDDGNDDHDTADIDIIHADRTEDEREDVGGPVSDELRSLDDDVEARRRKAELEERERLFEEARRRDEQAAAHSQKLEEEREEAYRAARDEAQREAEFERRKSEAALEQRLRSLASMERSLSEKADTLSVDAAFVKQQLDETIEERFAALSQELNHRLETASQAAQDPAADPGRSHDFADMADYVGRELSNLRAAMNDGLKRLSTRIDDLALAPESAARLSAKLADLDRLLDDRSRRRPDARRQNLEDVVRSVLPGARYAFNARLGDETIACLVTAPHDRAPIAISDQYPVDAYEQYARAASDMAANEYRRAVLRHILNVAHTHIAQGETADFAMAYAPSDEIAADLQANFPELAEDSVRARVRIVSPTSLAAALELSNALMAPSPGAPPRSHGEDPLADEGRVRHEETAVLEEIAMLRERVAAHYPDRPQIEEPPGQREDEGDHAPAVHTVHAATNGVASEASEPDFPSLSPEEEAFERLEREEALKEARERNASDDDAGERPPFPLR